MSIWEDGLSLFELSWNPYQLLIKVRPTQGCWAPLWGHYKQVRVWECDISPNSTLDNRLGKIDSVQHSPACRLHLVQT